MKVYYYGRFGISGKGERMNSGGGGQTQHPQVLWALGERMARNKMIYLNGVDGVSETKAPYKMSVGILESRDRRQRGLERARMECMDRRNSLFCSGHFHE